MNERVDFDNLYNKIIDGVAENSGRGSAPTTATEAFEATMDPIIRDLREDRNIYLAGAMTGRPDYNYVAFTEVADKVRQLTGCHVVHTANLPRGWSWWVYINLSLSLLRCCSAVAVLPDWEGSKGVKRELQLAKELDIPVFYLEKDIDIDALTDWAIEGR